jgi:hypothetical protein
MHHKVGAGPASRILVTLVTDESGRPQECVVWRNLSVAQPEARSHMYRMSQKKMGR